MSYYQLDYSGAQVNEAVGRILAEPTETNTSHIVDLESTETVPYNLDTLVSTGMYRCMYVDSTTAPAAVASTHPVYIFTAIVEDSSSETGQRFTQTVTCGLINYSRYTEDSGATWSEWDYPREITAEEVFTMFAEEGATDEVVSRVLQRVIATSTSSTSTSTRSAVLSKGYAS